MLKSIILFSFLVGCALALGPAVLATKGAVWPKPQAEEKTQDYYTILPHGFNFKVPDNVGCPNFLNDALTRYWTIIATAGSKVSQNSWTRFQADGNFLGTLQTLNIDLEAGCESEDIYPKEGDSENYTLVVDAQGATLSASTIWGVLRGLETFSQLIYVEQDSLIINGTTITDGPRFTYRGLLIDTSRHFEPLTIIFAMLDAMAYNKFNVFHWHIVDDHSFPYKSRTYPELSDEGAYHPFSKIYEQSDVARVIEYARLRGIRVIPEFDTPGHTSSWGASHPELLTACYSNNEPNGNFGPMDPTKNSTYDFVTQLFTEIVDVFPDNYFHIGGDEVDFTCWQNNPDVGTFMGENNIATYKELESFYIQHVVDILDNLESQYLVWEEVFVNGVVLPNSTVVHVWKNNGLTTLRSVVQAGKRAVYSSCWYLSDLQSGGDWNGFYKCEPVALIDDEAELDLVVGGEACMWGEYVNEFSIVPRVWPRASAVAERLWSDREVTDVNDAARRLEEHTCRMNKRGIAAQPPNGPGFCP
ncbi:hypothetical protein Zmor_019845 [Zophobas morio]|uniref:Beta-hexosaminidase n=2 Tax=Zophobas morio TaxID=2755281 RepID=A0AA38M986_9CUCU|nr:hypothetical protein Zmor_019845 [Zophobas morio]